MDIPEVPNEDDDVIQIEDELEITTEGAETEGTRHLDLLSKYKDKGQRQRPNWSHNSISVDDRAPG